MKKNILKFICYILVFTSTLFVSCSKNTPNNSNNESNSSDTKNNTTSNDSAEKIFTLDDLKKYDGQNGNPAYVAVNGKVYDVTNARKWKNGKHVSGVVAGTDLSNSIGKSPHGTSVLGDVPVVGSLR